MTKDDVFNFVKKNKEAFAIAGLCIICYFLYFFAMGNYKLIDVDETRYISMSRDMLFRGDWLTLYLNGDFFFEKPPLYFWLETATFSLFGTVNETLARIPVALTATFGVFITYFLGRKIASKKYGFISALILASSLEYIMLSRVAILDMLLSVCIATSAFAGIFTLFCKDKYKKYFWWFAYIFAGFGVLAKGIPAVVIPFFTILISYIIARRWKEIFKPVYMLPGVVLFLIISLPWHIIMLQQHGDLFFREYIYKHHIERFVNSNELGRKEPFWYFIPVFFVAFVPWIFSFVSQIIVFLKKSFKSIGDYFLKFNDLQPLGQFLVLNTVFFLVTFLFYSSASTKLPTYILPVLFPAALILGKFWFDYVVKSENERAANISTLILNFIFALAAIAVWVVPMFLPEEIKAAFMPMQIPGFILFMAFVLSTGYAIFKGKRLMHFASIVSFMALLSMFAACYIFPFIINFGENELISYAEKAGTDQKVLGSYGFGNRYSLLYYYPEHVYMLNDEDKDSEMQDVLFSAPDAYFVIKNKNIADFADIYNFDVLEKGNKYSLVNNIKVKKQH